MDASGSSANGNFSYSWTSNPASGIVTGANSLQPTVNEPGVYTLVVFNEDNSCQSSAEITVEQDITPPVAVANVVGQFDCITESLTLDGTGSSIGPNYVYEWMGIGPIDNATTLAPTVYEPGNYQITVSNLNNGCTQTDEVIVLEDENVPTADIQLTEPICFGDQGSIDISSVEGGDAPYLYSIDGGETFFSFNLFSNLNPGTYDILIQDAKGCEYEDEVIIQSVPEVFVNAGPDAFLNLGETHQIDAVTTIPLAEIDTIIWSPEIGLDCLNCLEPNVNVTQEVIYTITVVDSNGCIARDEITIYFDKTREVFIPNAFSPNNDGINDIIMIYAKADKIVQVNTFRIFDRWGEPVFEANDFQPNDPDFGWDGLLKGEELNPAVFVYFAEIEFVDGVTIQYKGDVTLTK